MDIRVEGNSVFEAISNTIFDDDWTPKSFEKAYLHTWFSRVGPSQTDQYERLLLDLQAYFASGEPSDYLRSLATEHPKFLDWFGANLVGSEDALRIVASMLRDKPYADEPEVPAHVGEVQDYLASLGAADKLEEIVGQPYPKPEDPVRCIISGSSSALYNVYPDTVVCSRRDHLQWYVAGYGHEAGHILTWDMCRDPEVQKLCGNEVTKAFAERVGELCNKLLLDACGIACNEVFPECESWDVYMYEKNPGKPLFDAMVEEIRVGEYSDLRTACVEILERFQ